MTGVLPGFDGRFCRRASRLTDRADGGVGLLADSLRLRRDRGDPEFLGSACAAEIGPSSSGFRTVRFLTDDEFPPLHFAGPDGDLTGFSVELARAACERLAIACTIQARRFDTLARRAGRRAGRCRRRGDPDHGRPAETISTVRAVLPHAGPLRRPQGPRSARCRTRKRSRAAPWRSSARPRMRRISKRSFPGAAVRSVPDLTAAEAALRSGEVDFVFADGLGLALWIGGTEAGGCCAFRGRSLPRKPLLRRGRRLHRCVTEDEVLRRAFDYALPSPLGRGRIRGTFPPLLPRQPVLIGSRAGRSGAIAGRMPLPVLRGEAERQPSGSGVSG